MSVRYAEIQDALVLLMSDSVTRAALDRIDPKAVEQAIKALGCDPAHKCRVACPNQFPEWNRQYDAAFAAIPERSNIHKLED